MQKIIGTCNSSTNLSIIITIATDKQSNIRVRYSVMSVEIFDIN